MTPTFTQLLRNPVHLLAFGLGSGLTPVAPGTAGTLAAAAILWLLPSLDLLSHLALVAVAIAAGVYICGKTAADIEQHDHPGIVWDEFAGYWLAMLLVPDGPLWLLAGFVLFRLFDIWKPWPISWLDEKVAGGWGIMLDDILAGIYAALIMALAQSWLMY